MTQRLSMPILLICAAGGVACGSEAGFFGPGIFEPEPTTPLLTTVRVTPARPELSAVAPGNTVQLTVVARDQKGRPMEASGATFSSSGPAIAGVSGSGIVTAAAPGDAVIVTTLTHGGITRGANIVVTVTGEVPGRYPDLAGVYDLTGLITRSDPVWGIEDGTRQTAVLTIRHSRNTPRFAGTVEKFCATDSNGESCNQRPGVVSGVINLEGLVVIELTFEGSQSSYWYGSGALASGQILGTYGAGGHIGGTFTAERRAE